MEILFKNGEKVFYKENDIIDWRFSYHIKKDYPDIANQSIIYHVIINGTTFPCFYNYKNSFIIMNECYYDVVDKSFIDKIDYTIVNINKILNGNII